MSLEQSVSRESNGRLRAVGQYLRDTREELGVDIYDAADQLRIRAAYLLALEEGDFTSMPGRPYAIGFLRSYADFLGFDADEVVNEVRQRLEASGVVDPPIQVMTPIRESRWPGKVAIVSSLVLAAAAYGVWHLVAALDREQLADAASWPGEVGAYLSELVETPEVEAPETQMAAIERAVDTAVAAEPPASRSIQAADASGDVAPAGTGLVALTSDESWRALQRGETTEPSGDDIVRDLGATGEIDAIPIAYTTGLSASGDRLPIVRAAVLDQLEMIEPDGGILLLADVPGRADVAGSRDRAASDVSTRLPADTLLSLVPADATLSEAVVFGDVEGAQRVLLVASEPSWVQVRSDDESYSWTRTLEAGEQYALPERSDLSLWTGNAGGLEVIIDGRNLGPVGERGQVLRDVRLAPERLLADLQ